MDGAGCSEASIRRSQVSWPYTGLPHGHLSMEWPLVMRSVMVKNVEVLDGLAHCKMVEKTASPAASERTNVPTNVPTGMSLARPTPVVCFCIQ